MVCGMGMDAWLVLGRWLQRHGVAGSRGLGHAVAKLRSWGADMASDEGFTSLRESVISNRARLGSCSRLAKEKGI